MAFLDLAKHYDDFLAPAFKLLVGGKDLVAENIGVLDVSVAISISKSDLFSATLNNPYDFKDNSYIFSKESYANLIAPGQTVEIELGYCDKLTKVFLGTIEKYSTDFPATGQSRVKISGRDMSEKLMKNADFKHLKDKKFVDVVKEIAQKHGYTGKNLELDTPEADDVKFKNIVQQNQDDYNFLKKLADKVDCEFFIHQDRFVFRKSKGKRESLFELKYGQSLIDFSSDTNLSSQVKEVIVIGWNETQREEVEGKAKISDMGLPQKITEIIENTGAIWQVRSAATEKSEADKEALSKLREKTSGLLNGSGSCIGLPDIEIGKTLGLIGLDKEHNGDYYITDVNHSIGAKGYTTQFNVRRSE